MSTRASYYKVNRPAIDALSAVGKHLASIDPKLRALIELRVSQINGCVFCVDRHSGEARAAGESQQRLDCLIAWRESRLFEEPERAALEWAEALGHVSQTHAPDAVYDGLVAHFSENQIVDLTLIVACMNAWNRIAIGHRTQPARR
jgi:AhpD family alkylhydroperoxidase